MKLLEAQKAHMIGIKGVGMTALAQVLQNKGLQVQGSDVDEHFFTDTVLEKLNIPVASFSKDNIAEDVDVVIYSTAWKDSEEYHEAEERGVTLKSYPEALAELFNAYKGIAVTGTHGKTTTSAMLAYTLDRLNLKPTAIIGSKVIGWDTNAIVGESDIFIIEADEYQNKLAQYKAHTSIITNIDFDHPDFYSSQKDYEDAFDAFGHKSSQEKIILGIDSSSVEKLSKTLAPEKVTTYSTKKKADFVAKNIVYKERVTDFEVIKEGDNVGSFTIQLPGEHNVQNALSVIALCDYLKVDIVSDTFKEALASFRGTARRFEIKGEITREKKDPMLVIDDYAHHPAEIQATLTAAKKRFPNKKIWAAFMAHTFSRTEALLDEFAKSFTDADQVLVADIYGSAREPRGTITGQDLAREINNHSHNATYIGGNQEIAQFVSKHIEQDPDSCDIFITLGAGDIWEAGERLLQINTKKSNGNRN